MDFLFEENTKISAHSSIEKVKIFQNGKQHHISFPNGLAPIQQAVLDGTRYELAWFRDPEGHYHVEIEGEYHTIELLDFFEEHFRKINPHASQSKGFILKAPIPGRIVKIDVEVGQKVKKGENLLVLSAMKLENMLSSPCAGTIKKIGVQQEDSVAKNQFLLELE